MTSDLERQLSALTTTARDEIELQDALQGALPCFEREFDLSDAGRVDFFEVSTGIAVEVKTKGSAYNVVRQLQRYELDPRVALVYLVTTVPAHVAAVRRLDSLSIRAVLIRRFP